MKKNKSFATYPYLIWSTLFIIIPLLLVFYYSITIKTDTGIQFSLENFKKFLNPLYIKVLLRSLELALKSTVLCLLIGYPVAYIISKMPLSKRNIIIMLFILPMWMNLLLRTYSWMSILGKNGILNHILTFLGLPTVKLLYTEPAVMLGMVYNFLPFMVIPIYTVLTKIDKNLIDAAADLGANRKQIFLKVILPLSIPGIMSGITMVFMPAVSTFVIPRLLGGGQLMLIGNLIEQQFTTTGDWNFGSAMSIFMMVIILISMGIMAKFDTENSKEGGGQIC